MIIWSYFLPLKIIFIQIGGGGVGKSYLIRTMSQWIEKILMKQAEPYVAVPYTPKVLLLAFTGSAQKILPWVDLCCFRHEILTPNDLIGSN